MRDAFKDQQTPMRGPHDKDYDKPSYPEATVPQAKPSDDLKERLLAEQTIWLTSDTSFDILGEAADRIAALEADHAKLSDPVSVHASMLRGSIAKPSWEQIKHLYPEAGAIEAQLAEAESDLAKANGNAVKAWEEREHYRKYSANLDSTAHTLRRQLAEARKALEPFAAAFNKVPGRDRDLEGIDEFKIERVLYLQDQPNVGDFRRADATLNPKD